MKDTLVVATHNQGKLREIRDLLAPLSIAVTSAGELGLPEPVEDGDSFIANAEIKSVAAARAAKLTALSDDSGLVVNALNGQPGIYSARWAGENKDFNVAMKRVWDELQAKNATDLSAYFICVLSLCTPDGKTVNFEGRVNGTLVYPPRGENGFGYDAMFIPDGHFLTFGQMDPSAKHAISHRAIAFAKFVDYMCSNTKKAAS
jgi:non-canonical purine NTP pyrophosphatase (RdgB/HAM1 family)